MAQFKYVAPYVKSNGKVDLKVGKKGQPIFTMLDIVPNVTIIETADPFVADCIRGSKSPFGENLYQEIL